MRPWALAAAALLQLASVVSAADKTAADYYVSELPGAPPGPLLKMHAGHIEVTPESHGHLFFWHFQNRHIGDKQRTVIWVNGGPGCSSLDGALMEIGPYRVREGGKLEYNNGSWDEFANVLFVDNPVGTGFSYVDTNAYVHELQDMADQFVVFLEKFFGLFPDYQTDDIYLAGESYAGQHIPYIAKTILERNQREQAKRWNLKGLLIGNGWISPEDQYPAYLSYSLKNGLLEQGSSSTKTVESQQAICMSKLKAGGQAHVDYADCEQILQDLLRVTQDQHAPANQRCVNMYDIRLRDSYSSCGMSWPPDLEYVTPWLRQKDVVKALHVDPLKQTGWVECNGGVSMSFTARNSVPSIQLLPNLLESVPIILFSGDKDLICNHLGTESLIKNMKWNGGQGFETAPGVWAPKQDWVFEGEPAGYWQQARNLSYVVFFNSSHMVPFDYSRRTRDMLDRFMGVDISSIGGSPQSSLIEGEHTIETSVGGHPNSTAAQQSQDQKLKQAEWHAYYRAGEAALVVVLIAAGVWAYFVVRARRRMRGYAGVAPADDEPSSTDGGLAGLLRQAPGYDMAFRKSRDRAPADIEASDFELTSSKHFAGAARQDDEYSLGSLDEDDTVAAAAHKQA